MSRSRVGWLGDLRTCYLLEEGWAFRLEVNRFLLSGRAGWRLPLAFAEAIELEEGEDRFLVPADPRFREEVAVSRIDRKCLGGPVDLALGALGATEGDLAFFVVRRDRYDFVLRRRSELDTNDPLGRLLWSCGLDPRDPTLRAKPWPLLARSLGRPGGTRPDVRSFLAARKDEALTQLVDELERGVDRMSAGLPWPEHWSLIMPMSGEETSYGLIGADRSQRIAVGTADTSGQPPRDLLIGAGGLLWLHHEVAVEPDEVRAVGETTHDGMHPTAHKAAWVRWLRAEHGARRSALLGAGWVITASDGRWFVGSAGHDDLLGALEAVRLDTDRVPRPPAAGPRTGYPVSGSAFSRAARNAVRSGLRRLSAHEMHGFIADYGDSERTGAALLDVLA